MFLYIKAFRSVIFAIVILVTVELLVLAKTGSKGDDYRLMDWSYLKNGQGEKGMIIRKINYLVNKDIDIVSVGDSSGMVSLNPKIIERYLGGMKMFNGSTQQPTGVAGYRYIAEIFLKNNPQIKYLIYHPTPYQYKLDSIEGIGFSPYIYANYLSYYRFIFTLPSTLYRPDSLSYTYRTKKDLKSEIPKYDFDYNRGFFAADINGNKDTGECNFVGWMNNKGKSVVSEELNKIKKITDEHGAKLIVIFGPSACTPGEKIKPIVADLEKFQKNNPDVLIPIGLINHLDANKFGDTVHIKSSATDSYSEMIGKILREKIVGKNSSTSKN